jgi:2-polyprenyl-3-methyl-5-hydroxy-6-metoxy-1,4-benzoquinol methylase
MTLQNNAQLQTASFADFEVPDFPRIRKVLRFLDSREPGICLDLGYCKGSFADYLADSGWICIATDIIERKPEHPNIQSIQSDLFRGIPLANESIDVITAGELIEHLTDETAFLQECWRTLKHSGCLALTTPNLTFSLNRGLILLGRMPLFVYAPYHYRFHTVKSLTELVQKNGFTINHMTSSHTLYSSRRHPTGRIFEVLGDILPSFGAHLILVAQKP